MQETEVIQGRAIGPNELEQIRGYLLENPSWNRTRLSRVLCDLWSRRSEAGVLKDMACRTLLLKLERRDLIQLPSPEKRNNNRERGRVITEGAPSEAPICGELSEMMPLEVTPFFDRGKSVCW